MWLVLGFEGEALASFPGSRQGWLDAVRWATRNGGELDIVFSPHYKEAA